MKNNIKVYLSDGSCDCDINDIKIDFITAGISISITGVFPNINNQGTTILFYPYSAIQKVDIRTIDEEEQ